MGWDIAIPQVYSGIVQSSHPYRTNLGLYQFGVPWKTNIEASENLVHENLRKCHLAGRRYTEDNLLFQDRIGLPDSVRSGCLICCDGKLLSGRGVLCPDMGNPNFRTIYLPECGGENMLD